MTEFEDPRAHGRDCAQYTVMEIFTQLPMPFQINEHGCLLPAFICDELNAPHKPLFFPASSQP